ncbi:SWIM zinc finger family protein [Haloarchaeobius salinus]|uniref:SWIM zinc finger family protein n=1 Tax=Haloarchaeobius salinus TaxID=1198298 RepID=UPI00210918C2
MRRRAEYEAFEFALIPEGVLVTNCSHADPSEHRYLVRVVDGLPASCSCPADERFDGACKHRVAVAIRGPVLGAAQRNAVATDGGLVPVEDPDSEPGDGDDCDCSELPDSVPCWPCFRDGEQGFENESLPD